MDLIMPRVDGVEATRRIMARTPCAIVVVTANVNDHSAKVFEAMGVGALDAVNTPVLERPDGRGSDGALLAKIETIRKLIGAGRRKRPLTLPLPLARHPLQHRCQLIGIGASAGGPAALVKVLAPLPADFPVPVIIVQHVDAQFAAGLANWLGGQTALRVRLAREGDRPEPGTALLAGRDSHLVFTGPTRLAYTREPVNCAYCPSIDVFFNSTDRFWPGDVIGVLLSGMGRDGVKGLKAIKAAGGKTIVQDESSSIVFGMAKAAIEEGVVDKVVPANKIIEEVLKLI
jgi:chemotaxis response regulator CheB